MQKRFLPLLAVLLVASLSFGFQERDDAAPDLEEAPEVAANQEEMGAADLQVESDEEDGDNVGDGDDDGESEIELLDVGDAAPALDIAEWVRGDEVTGFEDGLIYVVEFWATWCGPCKASMPHLAKLQEEYGDKVVFIGVSDEEAETVEAFLELPQSEEKTWDEIVSYRLAMDADKTTATSYLRGAGENGIPTAFIVGRQGQIEWIGHPMGMDAALKDIVAGEWDTQAFLAKRTKSKQAERERMAAMSKINALAEEDNWEGAIEVVDGLLADYEGDMQLLMTKFELFLRSKNRDGAYALADEIAEANWDNHRFLNGFAWTIATELEEESRDLEVAMRYALRSNELEDGDGSVLDTVARIYYEQGNLDEAIAWQERAIAAEAGVRAYEKALQKYRAELAKASDAETAVAETDGAETEPTGGAGQQ